MRIQHNIAALNAHRQLSGNNNAVSKNLEKLSSGYKINRAGDDAAGLAISEKMRGQIRGLDQAANNANDGISLIQTAEGGLNETHSILQRMKELATQSSNGTYQNAVDRENLTKEVASLKTEIDRIATSTNFNKINLLDGSLGSSTVTSSSANAVITDIAAVAGVSSSTITTAGAKDAPGTVTISYLDSTGKKQSTTVNYTDKAGTDETSTAAAITAALKENSDISANFTVSAAAGKISYASKNAGTDGAQVLSIAYAGTTTAAAAGVVVDTAAADKSMTIAFTAVAKAGDTISIGGKVYEYQAAADIGKVAAGHTAVVFGADEKESAANLVSALKIDGISSASATTGKVTISNMKEIGQNLTFQIGASGSTDQQVSLNIGNMSSKGLGLSAVSVATQENANKAIATIDAAINQVSGTRADLGALQNRLEHTVSNLGVTSENLTSAESRIRDVDMAKEMMEMTKNNVLTQAAQAMLAQANTQPQSVLQLLKG